MCYKGNTNCVIIAVRMHLLNLQCDLCKLRITWSCATATVESEQGTAIILLTT